MKNTFISLLGIVCLFNLTIYPAEAGTQNVNGVIKRLTYSGNSTVHFPCLSDMGDKVLYILENEKSEGFTKSIQILDTETGETDELFRNGTRSAPPPFSESPLNVGTKPPILSGDGRVAVFSLSIGEPVGITDHYLAVAQTDGTSFKLFPFPIKDLENKDLKSFEFLSADWERLSYYSVNTDGSKIACVVKGHLGPSRYGNPSAIITLDMTTEQKQTFFAPDFVDEQWTWTDFPKRPLTGGGWAFGLSGNGNKIIFGAQSSTDITDYDLYSMDWTGENLLKITDIKDRWFSLAHIDQDGHRIVFYYTGQKKQAIGSYLLQIEKDNIDITFLQTPSGSPYVEFFDMSGNGNIVAFLQGYSGKIFDIQTGAATTAFDENTEGYAGGISPMDFPRFPSFWCPQILSLNGDRVLLVGFPVGRTSPEIYLLSLTKQEKSKDH